MPAKQGGRQGDALGASNPFDLFDDMSRDKVTTVSTAVPSSSARTSREEFDMLWEQQVATKKEGDFLSQPFDPFGQDNASTTKSQAPTATATAEPDFFSPEYTSSSQQPQATTRAVEVNSDNDLLGLLTSQQPILEQPRTGQQVDSDVAEVLLIEEARARDQKEGNVNPFDDKDKGKCERAAIAAIALEERIAKSRIGQQRNPEQKSLAPQEEAPATHAESIDTSGKAEVTGNSVIKWLREAFSALHKTEQKSTTNTPGSAQIQAAQNNADVGSSDVALQPKEAAVKGRIAQGVINFFKSFSLPSFSRKSSAAAAPAPTEVDDFFRITPSPTSSTDVAASKGVDDPFGTQSFAGIEGVGEVGKILANAGVAQSGTSTAVVDGRGGAQPEGITR